MLGYVDDVREALARYAVFVCRAIGGSVCRQSCSEAFAAGIPVVSVVRGAEGSWNDERILADDDRAAVVTSEYCCRCWLADQPAAAEMAARARAEVEANWDMAVLTQKLVAGYRELVCEKRITSPLPDSDLS